MKSFPKHTMKEEILLIQVYSGSSCIGPTLGQDCEVMALHVVRYLST